MMSLSGQSGSTERTLNIFLTPKLNSLVHYGMLLTCAISRIKPFLRKIISLHFDGLQIILFSSDQIKNRSTKSSKNFKEHTSTSCSHRLFVCLIWRGPLASSHKGSLIHDEKSARKNQTRSFSEDMWKRHFVEGNDWCNNIFTSISLAISWDEFPQSPSQHCFKLNRKNSVFNKLLLHYLNRRSVIIKSTDCSQQGDKIIHGLKRKTKEPLGILRNR